MQTTSSLYYPLYKISLIESSWMNSENYDIQCSGGSNYAYSFSSIKNDFLKCSNRCCNEFEIQSLSQQQKLDYLGHHVFISLEDVIRLVKIYKSRFDIILSNEFMFGYHRTKGAMTFIDHRNDVHSQDHDDLDLFNNQNEITFYPDEFISFNNESIKLITSIYFHNIYEKAKKYINDMKSKCMSNEEKMNFESTHSELYHNQIEISFKINLENIQKGIIKIRSYSESNTPSNNDQDNHCSYSQESSSQDLMNKRNRGLFLNRVRLVNHSFFYIQQFKIMNCNNNNNDDDDDNQNMILIIRGLCEKTPPICKTSYFY